MEPHVIANRRLEQLSETDRRSRDAQTARFVTRLRRFARRRSIDQ
jgi:hypothetical protein